MTKSIDEPAPVPNIENVAYAYSPEYAHTPLIPEIHSGILIVENHPAIADMLCWTFELAGYQPTVIERAEATFEIAPQIGASLALMLLDLSVSLAEAQSFLEILRERWNSSVPVVILTTNKELQAAITEFPVILKPFHIHDLLAAIQETLVA